MHLTPHAQAVVLLTVAFEKSDAASAGPLTKGEWARLAVWLKHLSPLVLRGRVSARRPRRFAETRSSSQRRRCAMRRGHRAVCAEWIVFGGRRWERSKMLRMEPRRVGELELDRFLSPIVEALAACVL